MSEIAVSRAASSAMVAHMAATNKVAMTTASTTGNGVGMATKWAAESASSLIESERIQLRPGCVNASALQLIESAYACQKCFAPLRIAPSLLRVDAVIGSVESSPKSTGCNFPLFSHIFQKG
jgi:hypothetical protein